MRGAVTRREERKRNRVLAVFEETSQLIVDEIAYGALHTCLQEPESGRRFVSRTISGPSGQIRIGALSSSRGAHGQISIRAHARRTPRKDLGDRNGVGASYRYFSAP